MRIAIIDIGAVLAAVPARAWLTDMMIGLLTAPPVLAAMVVTGIAGLIGARLAPIPLLWRVAARAGGLALLLLACFFAGMRMERERSELAALRADNARLLRNLNNIREVAEAAAAERERLRIEKAHSDQKASEYEARLVEKLGKQKAADPCALDDYDLRWLDSLRKHRRAP
jgi:hypothetical protein